MTLQIKRRNTGTNAAPSSLASGELAWNAPGTILYIGSGDNGSGVATTITAIGGAGAFIAAALINAANGVAPLDSSAKVPLANLPASIVGAMQYQGVWNASTNSPSLTSGTGTKGYFYKVGTAGSTTLDGLNQWNVGDLALFDGTTWDKIDGIPSEVLSVAGRAGAVTLTSSDLTDGTALGRSLLQAANAAAGRLALNIESATVVSDAAYSVLVTDRSVQMKTLTASRILTLPLANTFGNGQRVTLGDRSGACSSSSTITINPSSSNNAGGSPDVLNGNAAIVLNQARAQVTIESDGYGAWTVISTTATAAASQNNIDGGSY